MSNLSDNNSPFRIFSMNTYLIPSFMVNKDNASCTNHYERATGIGKLINTYAPNVVTLQEMWGSNLGTIQTAISPTHDVLAQYKSWRYSVIDTIFQRAYSNGGLWVAHDRATTKLIDFKKEVFNDSKTKSAKGVSLSLFQLNNTDTLHYNCDKVIVCTLHTDPLNTQNVQVHQLQQCSKFLQKEISTWLKRKLINKVDTSNNNNKDEAEEEIDANRATNSNDNKIVLDCAIIITGDFNISSTDSLCAKMLSTLFNARDLYKEYIINYNNAHTDKLQEEMTYDKKTNSLPMYNCSERLDYILSIDSMNDNINGADVVYEFKHAKPIKVEVLKQPNGKELSDHWPVYADLSFE